jgi:antitoxin component YwqK of YwqJK toxin-antitoxin module
MITSDLRFFFVACAFAIWPIHGIFCQENADTLFYENGNIKGFGKIVNGKMDGLWIYYYPDGAVNAKENYKYGELHGDVFSFDFSGNLQAHEVWNRGVQTDTARYYFSSGLFERIGRFDDGLYDGEWRFYHESGLLKRVGSYKNGLPHGKWYFYNEEGIIEQLGQFEEGVEHGEWKFFAPDGRLEFSGSYDRGTRTGKWFYYNEKGRRSRVKP